MKIDETGLDGVVLFIPTPLRDDRGFFSRTFDSAVAARIGIDATRFVQDSQSRTRRDVLRGLHGRAGAGESKLMRCARGAVHLVIVDGRRASAAFGRHVVVRLDDEDMVTVHVPPGMFVGFQVLTEQADVCYRIDRPHEESESRAVRYDDPDLAVAWPRPPVGLSVRDREAGRWNDLPSGP